MKDNNVIAYEYKEFHVKRALASMYSDCMENFGWVLERGPETAGRPDTLTLQGKRDRKIHNKAELTRLQRQLDGCVAEIQSLESAKHLQGSIVAYAFGIIGTAFMAGSVFAVTSGMTALCVILAVPGFLGWILPYPCYRGLIKKKIQKVTPFIEQKYDEIYDICEKANALLVG